MKVVSVAKPLTPHMNMREASTVLLSLVTARSCDEPLLQQLLQVQQRLLPTSTAFDIATVIAAVSKSRHFVDEDIVRSFVEAAGERLREFSPQLMAHLIHGLARLSYRDEQFMQQVALQMLNKSEGLGISDVAFVAWAFSSLDVYDRVLFDVLGSQALQCAADINALDLSNIAWAFGKASHCHSDLFAMLAAATTHYLQAPGAKPSGTHAAAAAAPDRPAPHRPNVEFSNQQTFRGPGRRLAAGDELTSSRSLTMGHGMLNGQANSSSVMLEDAEIELSGEAELPAASFQAEQFSGHRVGSLASARRRLSPQGLANVLWAFSRVNQYDAAMFEHAVSSAELRLKEYLPEEVAQLATACAVLNHYSLPLFATIAQASAQWPAKRHLQSLYNVAWSAAVLQHHDVDFYHRIFGSIAAQFSPHCDATSLCQLHQAYFLAKDSSLLHQDFR